MSKKKKAPAPVAKSLSDAIRNAGPKPPDTETRTVKKHYAERLSNEVARYLAMRLRELGLDNCQPDEKGGRERQFAGGIGAKKVDVSFATAEDGLVLAISVKSICFRDRKTHNFQKNLTNRRGDLLSEATTLHQRFPYAVVGGFFLFDRGATEDATSNRVSTFITAHEYFRAFNNRSTQANAVQKFEELGIATYQSEEPFEVLLYNSGKPEESESVETFLSRLLEEVAERNPDRFRFSNGTLTKRGLPPVPDHPLTEDDDQTDE